MTTQLVIDEESLSVWRELEKSGPLEIGEIVERTGVDQAKVSACAQMGEETGQLEVQELEREELSAGPELEKFLESGLPERQVIERLADSGGSLSVDVFLSWLSSVSIPANEAFKWGPKRGWYERKKTPQSVEIVLTEAGQKALKTVASDELAIKEVARGPVFLDQLEGEGFNPGEITQLLSKRTNLVRFKKRKHRIVGLTASSRQALAEQCFDVLQERNVLTSEDLESGAWKKIQLRPYDVSLSAGEVYPAKIHPFRKILEQTRRAFLEMGFQEVVSPMVESSFWNFDALFQPQDHPARDMQDTFYMEHPKQVDLPAESLVAQVRQTHEDGGATGSEGWGYEWREDRAKQVVLRTHTTAATIRALEAHPDAPAKFFCVGWTFRNETISFKHLPVFHQVDGIVVDEHANLRTLLGTLQEFYQKMGFDRVKFKPAFYPYTEPSVDVVVFMESRGKWIEMGGSGVFRPEVTEPLGCRHPVLAWGLGLERLAMLRYGLSDIRELYRSNLDTLQEFPLCR